LPAVPRDGGIDTEAERLKNEFLRAPASVQETMLLKLRDNKGAACTQALADAIPKLGPTMQKKAREALSERLTRMTADTLGDKLRDANAEIRRAAALACAMKDDRSQFARLIDLLEDPDAGVARAAHRALKSLSGQDLGPPASARASERAQAAAAWKDWLKQQGRK
jgi:hypothetical protein